VRTPRRPPVALADLGGAGAPPRGPGPSPSSPGSSPTGAPAPSNQRIDSDELEAEPPHTSDALSGLESEVDPLDTPDDLGDPEEPPSEPLADENRAIVVYAARNLLNTVDARPVGHAWFSA
jgi:hypothetical protein